jgi:N-acetylglucosaminyldiphosphoundecaprenol N-acetyl-beta-D-mannosaminyltransferase
MANRIFGHRLDSMSAAQLLSKTESLVKERCKGFVTFCNVHMIMEAEQDSNFAGVLEESLLNLTDGAPLARILKQRGLAAERTAGPDMMPLLLSLASNQKWPVAFYGGSEHTLQNLIVWCKQTFPELVISYTKSPPFRTLSESENLADCTAINNSGAKLLFVGLGCPKQEKWMHKNRTDVNALMFGVGGAFSMVTGQIKRAPQWMQASGLEWLFRFLQEPNRLWKRYLILNVKFIFKLVFTKK